MRKTILICFLATVHTLAAKDPFQNGDIIFHRSTTRQSHAIAAATGSEFTHMGIIFMEDGRPFVFEAVQPVRKTPLSDWIARGRKGHYVIKRLRDTDPLDVSKLRSEVKSFLGKDYDWRFGWSDSRVYCSELVWKAYDRACGLQIGKLKKLADFDLAHALVKKIMEERYGSKIPYSMKVISPSDMFESDLLVTIRDR